MWRAWPPDSPPSRLKRVKLLLRRGRVDRRRGVVATSEGHVPPDSPLDAHRADMLSKQGEFVPTLSPEFCAVCGAPGAENV